LAAGLLGTGEPDLGRSQVIDQQQVGRRVFDHHRLPIEEEIHVRHQRLFILL